MALVGYDYSDSDSENEVDDKISSTTTTTIEPGPTKSTSTVPGISESRDEAHLEPTTSNKSSSKSENKVKISIPPLPKFDEEDLEESRPKRPAISSSRSGLLSLLPPVKGTILSNKSFIPNSIKNKAAPSANTKKLIPRAVKRRAEMLQQESVQKLFKKQSDSDVESDTELPETFDEKLWEKTCGRPLKRYKEVIQPNELPPEEPLIDIAPQPTRPVDGLDNEAFKELVGKSKRPLNIKLIDINEEEVLSDRDLWMTRSLTDPDMKPKPVIEEVVDPTRKKKHHITYLAEQAKANEEEFASNWAANKYSRNQTRAKYGF